MDETSGQANAPRKEGPCGEGDSPVFADHRRPPLRGGARTVPAKTGTVPIDGPPTVTLAEFQELIRTMYLPKDVARGVDGTFMWLVEEIGELAAALREGTQEEKAAEFADVLAWLTTIANVAGVDLSAAVWKKYGSGCPGCGQFVCTCSDAGKP